METAIAVQDEALRSDAAQWKTRATELVIQGQPEYDEAVSMGRALSTLADRIKQLYAPHKKRAHDMHKGLCDAEAELLRPVTEAKSLLSRKVGTWEQEQEEIRRAEQRRLEEEARKQHEEESLRIAEEQQKQLIEQGVSAEDAAAEANAIVEEAIYTPPPAVVAKPTFERARGVSTPELWEAHFYDMKALARAIGEGKAPVTLILPNQTAGNQMARSMKQTLQIPGVRAVKKDAAARFRR